MERGKEELWLPPDPAWRGGEIMKVMVWEVRGNDREDGS